MERDNATQNLIYRLRGVQFQMMGAPKAREATIRRGNVIYNELTRAGVDIEEVALEVEMIRRRFLANERKN